MTLYDLPTGSWTVTAQYVDNTTNPATTYRGTLTPAVSPTASPTAQSSARSCSRSSPDAGRTQFDPATGYRRPDQA